MFPIGIFFGSDSFLKKLVRIIVFKGGDLVSINKFGSLSFTTGFITAFLFIINKD